MRQLSRCFIGGISLACLLTVNISGMAIAQQHNNNIANSHKSGGHKGKQNGKHKNKKTKPKGNCKIRVGKRARRGHAVKPHIELEVVNQSNALLNFGENRNTKRDVILLKTSRRLPKSVKPGQFELDTLIPLRRIGSETEESSELKHPKYSRLHIFDHRERIGFTLCVDAKGGESGTFAGQYLLSGPAGISSATITQTAQLKATMTTFIRCLLTALFITLLALFFTRILPAGDRKARIGQTGAVILGLITAAVAMFVAYSETATWGADLFPSIAALVGTGFAAAGLSSIASSGATKVDLPKLSEYFPNPASPDPAQQPQQPAPESLQGQGDGEPEPAPQPQPAPKQPEGQGGDE